MPVIFDNLHHECFGSSPKEAKIEDALVRNPLQKAMSTWKNNNDGFPMVDYSSQDIGDDNHVIPRKGKHTVTIDLILFKNFLKQTEGLDFDIMLEIKDKEIGMLKAVELVGE